MTAFQKDRVKECVPVNEERDRISLPILEINYVKIFPKNEDVKYELNVFYSNVQICIERRLHVCLRSNLTVNPRA